MAQKLLTPINCHNFLPLVGSNWSSQTSYGSADSRTSEKHDDWGQDSHTFVIDLCTVTVVMVWISIEDSWSLLLELSVRILKGLVPRSQSVSLLAQLWKRQLHPFNSSTGYLPWKKNPETHQVSLSHSKQKPKHHPIFWTFQGTHIRSWDLQ